MNSEVIMDKTPVMVLHNINTVNGGMTFSVLKRAEALAEVCAKVIVVTYGFHRDFEGCVNYWRDRLNSSHRIHFLNLMEGEGFSPTHTPDIRPNEVAIADSSNPEGRRVFCEGVYARYEKRDSAGRLDFVDHFKTPWNRTRKDVYSASGQLAVTHYMSEVNNKISYSVYTGAHGKPCYSVKVNESTGKPSSFFLFDGVEGVEVSSIEELVGEWLKVRLRQVPGVILFVDKRELVEPLSKVPAERRIFCLHSTHLVYPSEDRSSFHPSLKPLKDNLHLFSKIICLTPSQTQDLRSTLGLDEEDVVTISHPQKPVSKEKQQPEDFFSYKISSVARYHNAKNLGDAIRAFSLVLKEFPGATYDLYGYGPEEDSLQKLIDELGIGHAVELRGFSSDTESIYRNSCLTVLSSQYEGQPLVLTESMVMGVPVVAYDVNYGPRDVIRDGIDGILVPKHDVEGLAKAIISILGSPELRKNLSVRAREVAERFGQDAFKSALIDKVLLDL
ncbi:glycosyltransferase [Corynebacterium sp. UMB8791]